MRYSHIRDTAYIHTYIVKSAIQKHHNNKSVPGVGLMLCKQLTNALIWDFKSGNLVINKEPEVFKANLR